MNKPKRIPDFFLTVLVLMLCAALLCAILLPGRPQADRSQEAVTISDWVMDGQSVSLPLELNGLSSRSRVTLTARIFAKSGDYIYLKSVYAPIKVYADGELLFSYGEPGSYPAFLLDPPTRVALIPLHGDDRELILETEYLAPSQRNTLTLHPLLLGTPDSIYARLLSEMGFSLFFSIVLIALGIILGLMAFVLTRFEKSGIAFFWLGLFSFCTGIWVFGECNLTGLFIKNPPLLYVLAFVGLFSMALPMMKFGLILLDLPKKHPLNWMCLFMELALALALGLQLLGKVSLARTMYLFHVLAPLAFFLFLGSVIRELVRNHNLLAKRFLLPAAALALFSLLEVGNYYLFHFEVQKSFFFQIGVLVFLLITSALCGYFIRDTFTLRSRNRQLSYELSLMEKQVEIQNQRHRLLSETSARIRQQRHDLRHHFAVIRSYLSSHDDQKLSRYLDDLSANIPEEPFRTLCENDAVNAVALHYLSAAKEAGISSCQIRLDIPQDTGGLAESDLCVIVGNLLENAVDACRGIPDPFIRMKSRLDKGILTITMDNRCDSASISPSGPFPSSKPGGGTGLASIRSVAEKYDGGCRFEAKDRVFFSSVYVRQTPVRPESHPVQKPPE